MDRTTELHGPRIEIRCILCFQYYLKPFHAYEKGNMSWDAAWEAELAAKSVHSTTFDPEVTQTPAPRKKFYAADEKARDDTLGRLNLNQSWGFELICRKSLPCAVLGIGREASWTQKETSG